MRNINELVGIIKGISFDGIVNSKEIAHLQEWVDKNRSLAYDKRQVAIIKLVDTVLEDHIITETERDQILIFAEDNLQSVTSDISKVYEFNGIIEGIVCDGIINEDEIIQMKSWLDENSDLIKSHKSSESIFRIIEIILEDGVVTEEEQNTLLKHLESIIDHSKVRIKINQLRKLVRERKSIGVDLISLLDNEMAIDFIHRNAESQLRIALQSNSGAASADEELIFISLCLIGMMGYNGNYYDLVRETFSKLYQEYSLPKIEGTIRTILNRFRSPEDKYINRSRIINLALFNSIVPAYFLPAFFEFISDVYVYNFEYELPDELYEEFKYVYVGLRDDLLTEGDDIQLNVTRKSYKLIQSTKKMILDESGKWLDSVIKLSIIVVKLIDQSFWGKEIHLFNPYLKGGFEAWQKTLQKDGRDKSRKSEKSFRSNWEPRFILGDMDVYLDIPAHRIPPQYNYYDIALLVMNGDEIVYTNDTPDIREIIGGYRVKVQGVKLDNPLGELRYYVTAGEKVLYESGERLFRDFLVFNEQGYELKNNTDYKGTAVVCSKPNENPLEPYYNSSNYWLGASSVSYGDLFNINDQVFSFSSLIKMGIVGQKISNQFVKPRNRDIFIPVFSEMEYLVFESTAGTDKIEIKINEQIGRLSDFQYKCDKRPSSNKYLVNLGIESPGIYTVSVYEILDGKRARIDLYRFAFDPVFSLQDEAMDEYHHIVSVKSGLCKEMINEQIDTRLFSEDWLKFYYQGTQYEYHIPLSLALYKIDEGMWHPLSEPLWIGDIGSSSLLKVFGLDADELIVYDDTGKCVQNAVSLKTIGAQKETPIEFLSAFKQSSSYTVLAFLKEGKAENVLYCYNKCVMERGSLYSSFDFVARELYIEPNFFGRGNVVLEISRCDNGEVIFIKDNLESGETIKVGGIESFVDYHFLFFEKPKGLVLQKNRELVSYDSRFYARDDLVGRDYRILEVQFDQFVRGNFVRKTHTFKRVYVYLTQRIKDSIYEGEIVIKTRDREFLLDKINPVEVEICSDVVDEMAEMSITKDGDGLLLDFEHHGIMNTLEDDNAIDIFSYYVDMNGELIW